MAKGGFKRKQNGQDAPVRDNRWRVRVQIERELYKGLKAYLIDIAPHRSAVWLAAEFRDLPFEPYAPVRQQLLNLLRYTNRRRQAAGLPTLGPAVLRYRRSIVRPFEPIDEAETVPVPLVKATGV